MPFILLAPIERATPVPQIISPRSALSDVIAAATWRAISGKIDGARIVRADIQDLVALVAQEGKQLGLHGKAA